MSTKNKRLIKVTAFAVIFAVLFLFVTWVFSFHPDHRTYQLIGGFYKEPENSLHGIYIGSSNCYAFWNPLMAWRNYGLAIYPYACGSMPFYAAEYLIKEARKTQPDALFIVNVNAVDADDLNAAAIHNLINYMPNSQNRTELKNYLADLIGYTKLERLEFDFPWIRLRGGWGGMLVNGVIPKLDGLKGASNYGGYLSGVTDITQQRISTDKRGAVPADIAECVESLLSYCDSENVNVLFVTVPRAEYTEAGLSRINAVNDMLRAGGYTVMALTDQTEAIGLDLAQDYYNAKHTNIHGSIKFTNYICEYLIERYGMKDMRGNSVYDSWDTAWELYSEVAAPYTLDIERDAFTRDLSLAAPDNLRVSIADGSAIVEWEHATGADVYAVYRKAGRDGAWRALTQHQVLTHYLDLSCEPGGEYFYTVVPARMLGGKAYYGNFSYTGVSIKL